jgi:hypothetical protein
MLVVLVMVTASNTGRVPHHSSHEPEEYAGSSTFLQN